MVLEPLVSDKKALTLKHEELLLHMVLNADQHTGPANLSMRAFL